MKLTIGFSPCPNDTFIFDALVNHKIDTGDLSFDVALEDVETLNEWALQGKLDITKLSYAVLPMVLDNYIVLNSGSALGTGVGPLLISKSPDQNNPEGKAPKTTFEIDKHLIAIPGENTTAHLLFSLAFPNAKNKIFLRYDKIENFVLAGKGLGVIIHENRFTYIAKGLYKITDLGGYWEKETALPIPLGGIAVKRSVDLATGLKIEAMIKKSIAYAYRHQYQKLSAYVIKHAKEMSEVVMRKHIDLYVNQYSTDLGIEGKIAIEKLLNVYQIANTKIPVKFNKIFLSPAPH